MAKKGFPNGRIDPQSLKNGGGVNRFANSRCKPPGLNKPVTKKPDDPDDNLSDKDKRDKKFKNTGF